MDPDKIAQLANLLRESGNKLLNDNFKLTLSGKYKHNQLNSDVFINSTNFPRF